MSISPILGIVEFLELKEALCHILHEYKAAIKDQRSFSFWLCSAKQTEATNYAERIAACDTIEELKKELSKPPLAIQEIKDLLIKEANSMVQSFTSFNQNQSTTQMRH
jgi:hypothetical protein